MLKNSDKKIILNYHNISDYDLNDLHRKLPRCYFGYEKSKIKRYQKETDQKRSLTGKIAIAGIISRILKIDENKLVFSRDSFDKPMLKKPMLKKINFNISHSGEFVIVGVSLHGKIGVDIEKIVAINLKIAEEVFTKKEMQYVYENKKITLKRFYQIWSLKESFVKAVGEGLSYPLKNFYFEFENGKIIHKIKSRKSKWKFKTYNINKAYKTAICLENGDFPVKINKGSLW